jgi:arsenate reductase (thioredoxin)
MIHKARVLFICTHNSARSQMAEGYLRTCCGDRYEAFSAGTEITSVHPLAIQVMHEIGIDILHHRSKLVDEFYDENIDIVVTVCSTENQTCPSFPGALKTYHVEFDDPSGFTGSEEEKLIKFRRIRDEITRWIDMTFGKRT